MNKQRLTEWFGPDVKPTIPGIYDTYDADDPDEKNYHGAQYWDGNQWCKWGFDREDAVRSAAHGKSIYQRNYWRGLAEDPKKSP
jgi:hypothetical protein